MEYKIIVDGIPQEKTLRYENNEEHECEEFSIFIRYIRQRFKRGEYRLLREPGTINLNRSRVD